MHGPNIERGLLRESGQHMLGVVVDRAEQRTSRPRWLAEPLFPVAKQQMGSGLTFCRMNAGSPADRKAAKGSYQRYKPNITGKTMKNERPDPEHAGHHPRALGAGAGMAGFDLGGVLSFLCSSLP